MVDLKVGDIAPLFQLLASHGQFVRLKDYHGKKNVVLYFYPKDDTPGCTIEACGFRDFNSQLEDIDAVVLGVSPDGLEDHQKFITKFNLPFLLLSDEDKKVCDDYGVWVDKNMYGRKYKGVARTTFLIDKKGKIVRIFEKVKPNSHNQEVLEGLKDILKENLKVK